MRKMTIFMAWLIVLVDCLGCTAQRILSEAPVSRITKSPDVAIEIPKTKISHERTDLTISLALPSGSALLNAESFRPHKITRPKTLVIMVPGSGNVSRRGENNTDGITTFKNPLDINLMWAQSLADSGLIVLAYDKRTCNSKINPLCQDNWHGDIDEEGITALARDLDQVCAFAENKLEGSGRLVLLSTTQGAQVISLSNCLKKAAGVVLLSPVIGDLDKLWINGLNNASVNAKSDRNQLKNRKESMEAFFNSLKKGDFPKSANIKGASLKFWQSWIEASPKTLPKIIESKKPALAIFSAKDFFSPNLLLQKIKNEAKNSQFQLKIIEDSGRNLADEQGVSAQAFKQISLFIKSLP